jgi:integrase
MVCRIAGFTAPVQIAKLKGIGKEIEVKPKYEVITSHTMRRTFITIMSVYGLTPKEISLMSGHAQQSIVDIYDKTKADSNAVKVFEILKGRV